MMCNKLKSNPGVGCKKDGYSDSLKLFKQVQYVVKPMLKFSIFDLVFSIFDKNCLFSNFSAFLVLFSIFNYSAIIISVFISRDFNIIAFYTFLWHGKKHHYLMDMPQRLVVSKAFRPLLHDQICFTKFYV